MSTFAQRGGSFLTSGVLIEAAPASGSTVKLEGGTVFYNTKATTTAALTLQLPGAVKGDTIVIKSVAAITALTWITPNGTATTANGLPAALTAGQAILIRYTSAGWTNW